MPGAILVVDAVSTNRIVLKAKLTAAGYRVEACDGPAAAAVAIARDRPDLVVLDISGQDPAALDLCAALKSTSQTQDLPIVATGGFGTPEDRVAALRAGADDVLARPFDDLILQARIRSLLRARDATEELRLREDTRHALGFAEPPRAFAPPQPVTVISAAPELAGQLCSDLARAGSPVRPPLDPREALAGAAAVPASALYIIDGSEGVDDLDFYRLLSELRSRTETRHAALLVLVPEGRPKRAAMALDLGADDLAPAEVAIEEIDLRARALLKRQREAEALRATLKSGLEAAVTDPLTGLYNRRYALPHLERIAAHARTFGRQFALMVLDLDHFKAVNDCYGHAAGDEVLRQVATRLRANLRPVDLLARVGGEEFLVAMPDTTLTETRKAAERLVRVIRETPFRIGRPEAELTVTVSIGIRLSDDGGPEGGPGGGQDPVPLDQLMEDADVALYAAKTAGRDTVSLSAA